jgi:hypothetical protein
MKYNVIIPMAGEGSRFGYKFKPFIKLDNRCFIEHVMDSFLSYDETINSYNFIVTKEQEKIYKVEHYLKNIIFKKIKNKINIITLPTKTKGVYQSIIDTLGHFFHMNNYFTNPKYENLLICDCDHQIDIYPIIDMVNNEHPDIIIPTWDISYDEQHNWGKISMINNKIDQICEKEIIEPTDNNKIYGMIGCYYFKSPEIFVNNSDYINISDYLKQNYTKYNVKLAKITNALFFGTPAMVVNAIKEKRKRETIICDIDGVLIKHNNHSDNDCDNNNLIGGCVDKLFYWKNNNKKIILMSARSENQREGLVELLHKKNIKYDDLILGVNPGTRYIINDIKPSNIFTKQAIEINLERDKGIDSVICEEYKNNDIKIIKKLKGGSFSDTYLLEKDKFLFVRKYIIKNDISFEHYPKLKRQCEDMRRFFHYDNTIVPKVIREEDNKFDYYYDMEYLNGYKQLDEYDEHTIEQRLTDIISKLKSNVYCYKKINTNRYYVEDFFNDKIYPKLSEFEKNCKVMDYLINTDEISINGTKYCGLRNTLKKLDISNFNTEFINPIHGDLTLENILINEFTSDIKVIDMEGSRYTDSCYFDLGKLFQSLISKYHIWSNIDKVILNNDINNLRCVPDFFSYYTDKSHDIIALYSSIMGVKSNVITFRKGIFYMATYFIRFVQFRRKVSKEHGIFSLIMAVVWLNNLLK